MLYSVVSRGVIENVVLTAGDLFCMWKAVIIINYKIQKIQTLRNSRYSEFHRWEARRYYKINESTLWFILFDGIFRLF